MSERSAGSGAGVRSTVVAEEVRMERSGPVAELELDLGRTGKVREPGLLVVQRARAHVQREPAHLPRAPVERAPAHGRQLLQPPLFAPLVLEPHLRTKKAQRVCSGPFAVTAGRPAIRKSRRRNTKNARAQPIRRVGGRVTRLLPSKCHCN